MVKMLLVQLLVQVSAIFAETPSVMVIVPYALEHVQLN